MSHANIDFTSHRIRSNAAGAREDFEAMVAHLVRALTGDGHRVDASDGDGGVDVLSDDVDRRLTVYQAEYFIDGVGRNQYSQIRRSFRSARRRAAERGATVDRWILCLPVDLGTAAHQWWADWKRTSEAETGITIELWAAAELRHELSLDAAAPVRARFYGSPPARPAPVVTVLRWVGNDHLVGPADPWADGDRCDLAGGTVILRDIQRHPAGDGAWALRMATGIPTDGSDRRHHLRQIVMACSSTGGLRRQHALRTQQELLRRQDSGTGLPPLIGLDDRAGAVTLVTERPAGATWAESFPLQPPGSGRTLRTRQVAAAIGPLVEALTTLHGAGLAHGEVGPRTVVVDREGRARLLDLGGAGGPPLPCLPGMPRPPEQSAPAIGPDHRTDLYLVAALVHLALTGFPPSPPHTPPVAASVPGFPAQLDQLVLTCLSADPGARPHDGLVELREGLAAVRWASQEPGNP